MSRNVSRAAAGDLRQRRRKSALWSAAAAVVIIVLIALEQVALLYLIGTLSVALLLVVVALSDLRDAKPSTAPAVPADDAAAIADRTAHAGLTASATTTITPARRAPKRRTKR